MNTGQNYGAYDADIDAPEAWDITTGSTNTIIGILEMGGVWSGHSDLSGKVSGDPQYDNHGTHVAGIASASTNNNNGIAGIDWNARIVSKYLGDDDTDIYHAIDGAVRVNLSDIINNSWVLCEVGTCLDPTPVPRYSTLVRRAFANAYKLNAVSAAAMGNFNTSATYFPAGYGQGIIAVGATNRNDSRWVDLFYTTGGSNTGSHIDVVAPGQDVLSTVVNGPSGTGYEVATGTSMATPHISGIAGLMLAVNPGLYNDDIENLIRLSAEDKGSVGFDDQYGYGRVNARRALDLLRDPYEVSHYSTTGGSIYSSTGTYKTTIYDAAGLAPGVYIVKRHEVRTFVGFPTHQEAKVWGRGVASKGWNIESPNFALSWVGVVPGTATSTSATLQTYTYEVWDELGNYLGWYPASPGGVVFAYTVHGKPEPIPPDPFSVSLSGTMTLDNVNDWGDWTAHVTNPPDPTITYQWWLCPFSWEECQYMESHTTTDVYDHYIGYPVSGEDFYVKVIAISGGQSAEATHEVDILDNGMSLASAALKDSTSAAAGTQMKTADGAVRAGLTALAAGEPLPEKIELGENYPNPFSRTTTIEFALPEPAEVRLVVFDVVGREVARPADGQFGAGRHRVAFDAGQLSSGTYFYRLTTAGFSQTKRMVLLR